MLWRLSEKINSRKSIHLKSFLDIGQKYSFYQKMIFGHRPKPIIRGQKKSFFQKMNSEIWTRMYNLQYRHPLNPYLTVILSTSVFFYFFTNLKCFRFPQNFPKKAFKQPKIFSFPQIFLSQT